LHIKRGDETRTRRSGKHGKKKKSTSLKAFVREGEVNCFVVHVRVELQRSIKFFSRHSKGSESKKVKTAGQKKKKKDSPKKSLLEKTNSNQTTKKGAE